MSLIDRKTDQNKAVNQSAFVDNNIYWPKEYNLIQKLGFRNTLMEVTHYLGLYSFRPTGIINIDKV